MYHDDEDQCETCGELEQDCYCHRCRVCGEGEAAHHAIGYAYPCPAGEVEWRGEVMDTLDHLITNVLTPVQRAELVEWVETVQRARKPIAYTPQACREIIAEWQRRLECC